ncbi:putative GATA-binding transcription factor [Tieghemostelium lacteum]|uniref:Putative GATA-binding transcription factor n=1 Tax=Tieghemostelium lacteum TaxID=361077 RepID=A0A152A3V9_TIELA|nr:putative GATA-binding transcription factor [Tieghemostelium lacteum]|eukprot:KYR00894.1 putative GATA-binding transcription factor [Tieghemostelium lacteum]
MESTMTCNLCHKSIDVILFLYHVFGCVCDFSDKHNVPRLCTCMDCNGRGIHPPKSIKEFRKIPQPSYPSYSQTFSSNSLPNNDSYVFNNNITRVNTSPSTQGTNGINNNNSQINTNNTNTDELRSSIQEDPVTLSNKLAGKMCVICGSKKTGTSRIPTVHVGSHHKLVICKKSDLTSKKAKLLIYYIDLGLKTFDDKGFNDTITNGSDNEDIEDNTSVGERVCDGYLDLLGGDPQGCAEQITNYKDGIWIVENKDKLKSFCRSSHLYRYLIKWYSSGRRAEKPTRKRSQSVLNEEGDEDVEDDEQDEEEEEEEEQQQQEERPKKRRSTKSLTTTTTITSPPKTRGKTQAKQNAIPFTDYVLNLNEPDFKDLFGFPKDVFYQIVSIYKQSKKFARKVKESLILLFLEIRHYPVTILLSSIFQLPLSTCHTRLNTYKFDIFHLFKKYISLGTLKSRMKESKDLEYSNIPVSMILDGSEQPIESTSNLLEEPLYYSTKKKQHSINIVVGISPLYRRILYFSDSYPGATNDNIIVNTDLKWILKDELVIGDQGFNGINNIHTLSKDGETGRLFSSVRTLVENGIEDIKVFRSCRDKIRTQITKGALLHHNLNWTIVAGLRNRFLLPDNKDWYSD